MLYRRCDTGESRFFTNSLPHIDPSIWAKDFELWFVSPKDFIPLLYCSIFVRLGYWSLLTLFFLSQQWFLDSNSAKKASFIESSSYGGCWHIFSQQCFSYTEMFGAVSLLSNKMMTLMKLFSWWFWSISSTFCLVLSYFLMSPNCIIQCSSGSFYF